MKRSLPLVIVACLGASSCDRDPATAVKITSTPAVANEPARTPPSTDPVAAPPAAPAPAAQAAGPPRPADPPPPADGAWRPNTCPPPPEPSGGPGTMTVKGPCEFQHRGIVSCEASVDDFILTMSRPAARGGRLMVYINVEKYKGPGTYDGAQMFVGVQDKTSIYRWSSDEVTVTVDAGEKSATLPETHLPPEPMLVDCSGPLGNYQCAGRALDTPIDATESVVSGTMMCGKIGVSDK